MEHIGDALRGFLKNTHLERRIAECEPVLAWERIVGPEIAAHATALRLRGGVLWVSVDGSGWMQHLGFLKPRILEALRREFPAAGIRDLRWIPGGKQPSC